MESHPASPTEPTASARADRAGRPAEVHGAEQAAGEDPVILLLHPLRAASAEVAVSISSCQRGTLVELLTSRGLTTDVGLGHDAGGLAHVRVKVGTDSQAVEDVADCLEIMLQLLGRVVFGPLADPAVVDVERSGRDAVADAVERAFTPLRRHLPGG